MASAHFFIVLAAFLPQATAWSCNDEGASEMLQKEGLANVDDRAVCNDGTEAFYYIKENGNPDVWIVYLSGGGWCFDEDSCTQRFNGTEYPHHACSNSSEAAPCFMSSKDYPETCGKTGIFDTDRSKTPLHAANKVYVPYCSSDGHMGDSEFSGWQFRGARIVRSVISALKTKNGLGKAGSTLIFGGGSAGGRGAMVLLDEIAKALPEMRVHGFLDSPYYIDVPSDSGFNGFQEQHVGVLENFNGTSVISSDCAAAYETEPWKCLFGQYRMPFLTTPYLLAAAQFDGWQLSHEVHDYSGIEKDPVYTREQLSYVERFGAKTRAFAQTLPSTRAPWAIVYSTACYNHHISEHTTFGSTATSKGVTESDAVALLLEGKGGQFIDHCASYNCGSGCGETALLLI